MRFSVAGSMIGLLVLIVVVAGCSTNTALYDEEPDTALSGDVLCGAASLPLAGVNISVSWGGPPPITVTAQTDSKGSYLVDLDALSGETSAVEVTVRATKAGYADYEATVSVEPNTRVEHDFSMVPLG